MEISFKSVDDDFNEISYRSDANYQDGYLVFNDNQYDDTTIYLKVENNEVILIREGQINMKLQFNLKELGNLSYETQELAFRLKVKGQNIIKNDNLIHFEYDLFDDEHYLGNHKIWINVF